MWRPYGTKLGLLATIGVLRLLAPTPPQAQTRCLRGTPFALVAQDDKNKKSSNGAPKGAPLQSKSQDSRENPHTERDNCLLKWEFPRLCRGGTRSLTDTGVHPRNSWREPRSTRKGETGWTSMKAYATRNGSANTMSCLSRRAP